MFKTVQKYYGDVKSSSSEGYEIYDSIKEDMLNSGLLILSLAKVKEPFVEVDKNRCVITDFSEWEKVKMILFQKN